ncbi:MAG: hypothetical protein IAB19_08045 [Proteobacteria bacterium]|uniref:Uncharacterized protein n=1 Tax=Candidatus Avisuccinivibrio stercorigallinarum TaxID=2840704 RepID=A0A9D9DDA6_9GAMM|nr:hypothetical protein [Candidatus Avisuccinivibrio stercorigallinarum]
MFDNEKVDRFIDEALREIEEIDRVMAQNQAAMGGVQTEPLSAADDAQVKELMARAEADAKEAGQRRIRSVDISIDAPSSVSSGRARSRRTLI